MTKVKIKMNEAGLRQMSEEMVTKIAPADEAFRKTHTGYPVEVVIADAPAAYSCADAYLARKYLM